MVGLETVFVFSITQINWVFPWKKKNNNKNNKKQQKTCSVLWWKKICYKRAVYDEIQMLIRMMCVVRDDFELMKCGIMNHKLQRVNKISKNHSYQSTVWSTPKKGEYKQMNIYLAKRMCDSTLVIVWLLIEQSDPKKKWHWLNETDFHFGGRKGIKLIFIFHLNSLPCHS